MNREILFPTPIYFKMVKDPKKLNKHLFKHIKAWSKKDKTETKTNAGGGWHSPTDMNFKKEYQPLIDELFGKGSSNHLIFFCFKTHPTVPSLLV